MSAMKGSKTVKGRTTQQPQDAAPAARRLAEAGARKTAAAAATAERLADLLDAPETPTAVRETVYTYTVLALWFQYVDDFSRRPPRPPRGKALGAWVRRRLPLLLTLALCEGLRVEGVPTMPTFRRQE
jgi:hypothetical protein